ncbi:putative N-acetyltransferase 8B [Acanthochromis polyacanthus]|uniref:putative N-acetyltransferase 8B n=1 Tax=Acanthochromis polyacanthus TaxID=80966 RepID=UPI00223415CF|nr:putative N-acetyltransferase 8B [Acanthochromis polyacanthus]
MQLVIRRYRPSDKDTALALFSICTCEQIGPCFRNAMTSPLYLAITLALCVAGYLLGSVLWAVLLPAVWVGFIYYCSYELYDSYVREHLRTDMQDIPGNYLSRPDDCFWVAEAEVDGRPEVLGTGAVVVKHSGKEKHGWLCRMMVSQQCRRLGLGRRLAQTGVDFCKERGFSKVVLETSSTQMPAVALYNKLGFSIVASHTETEAPSWIVLLARATMFRMEKKL